MGIEPWSSGRTANTLGLSVHVLNTLHMLNLEQVLDEIRRATVSNSTLLLYRETKAKT